MVSATVRPQPIDRKGLRRLALEAAEDPDSEARRFWTSQQITLTLVAIEDIREGYSYPTLIDTWFVPFVFYLRRRPAGRLVFRGASATRLFRNFARRHGIAF